MGDGQVAGRLLSSLIDGNPFGRLSEMRHSYRTGSEVTPLKPPNHVVEFVRTSRRAGSLDPGRAPGRPPMSCCPPNYLGLTQLGRPINLILRHAAPQGANAGFVIASHSSELSRTAATPVTTASAVAATAPAPLRRPINLILRQPDNGGS